MKNGHTIKILQPKIKAGIMARNYVHYVPSSHFGGENDWKDIEILFKLAWDDGLCISHLEYSTVSV